MIAMFLAWGGEVVLTNAMEAEVPDGCTGDFENWADESEYCYLDVEDKKSWYDAQDFCSALGGDLTAIHRESEMTAILQHTNDIKESRWIGLFPSKDQQGDGSLVWKWVDGTNVNYTYWTPGEPNGSPYCDTSDCCGDLWYANDGYHDGHWDDFTCSHPFRFVCQKRKDPCSGFTGYKTVCYEPEWSGLNVCMVLVETNFGTCNTYCENQGSRCVKAQDNVDGCTRQLNHREGCDMSWVDQICVCESLTPEAPNPCADFNLNKCSNGGLIEKLDDIVDEAECQFFCAVIYKHQGCQFYIYDTQQLICELREMEMKDYVQSCTQVGGPVEPDVENCILSTHPCRGFLQGSCEYHGDVLEHLKKIGSVEACQLSCEHRTGCYYFLYDEELDDCKLLSTDERKCDFNLGLPEPVYTDCLNY